MASTGKTKTLGLCQWEASDPFLREDMNGDFAKIDEAVGSRLKLELLRDISLPPQTVKQIDMDVSDIDFTDYMFFIMRIKSLRMAYLRANGSSEGFYSMGSSRFNEGMALVESGNNIIFYPLQNGDVRISCINLMLGPSSPGYMESITYSQLRKLNFVIANSNNKFDLESDIKLWGVRI